jgi:hypothetical protein
LSAVGKISLTKINGFEASDSSPRAIDTLLSLGCVALLTLPRHCRVMRYYQLVLGPMLARTFLPLGRPVRTEDGAVDHARRNLRR